MQNHIVNLAPCSFKNNTGREDNYIEIEQLEDLSDEQICDLLKKGLRLRHKTMEERIAEFGGKLEFESFDWGEPVGREIRE